MDFIQSLFNTIEEKKKAAPKAAKKSYTASLFASGRARIAQKVGEEAVESVIAAMKNDKKEFIYEMADLWYHSLVLISDLKLTPSDIVSELEKRHAKKQKTPTKNRHSK